MISTLEIPAFIQFFKHLSFSIIAAPSRALSQLIILLTPENTRSGLSLIAGIEKISIAIYDNFGHYSRCLSWSHQLSADDWRFVGPYVINWVYSSSLDYFITTSRL